LGPLFKVNRLEWKKCCRILSTYL